MRKLPFLLLILTALASLPSMAICVLDTKPPYGGSPPVTMTIAPFTIRIDADAPADRSLMISEQKSTMGALVSYECVPGDIYGKETQAPLGPTTQDKMFATDIPGIEIRPIFSTGRATGRFPSTSKVSTGRVNFPATSSYSIEVYKTQKRLNLSNPAGDVVIGSGIIAYTWINTISPDTYSFRLQIGEIRIISTPVCRLDGEKSVDFNIVSATNVGNGVKRPLDFSLVCITDYGNYTASASLSTQTPTSDNAYIQVVDSAGNSDRLKIRVDDSNGNPLPVDASRAEVKSNIATDTPAKFTWNATLLRASGSALPENGKFNARAEIVLQVN
ncbi:fimbrial protein [Serratia sp. L9]|uniref:fimbrial protein n=1 Tax=Serratia sp. L9 TaxID=3423946 RepID=UPI003D66A2A8